MIVQLLVIVGADIAAREDLFKMLEEGGIDRHDVFEVTMDRAVLHHQDLAIALDDLRLDLADLLVQQDLMRQLAIDDLLADGGHALGAEGVGGAGPAEGRLFFLVALEKRLVAPLGRKALVRANAVEPAEDFPAELCYLNQTSFDQFRGLFCHGCVSPENHTAGISFARKAQRTSFYFVLSSAIGADIESSMPGTHDRFVQFFRSNHPRCPC